MPNGWLRGWRPAASRRQNRSDMRNPGRKLRKSGSGSLRQVLPLSRTHRLSPKLGGCALSDSGHGWQEGSGTNFCLLVVAR